MTDLSQVAWSAVIPAIFLLAVTSTFLGLFIAVSVSEVSEAQTFSNFFRFPMIFLCGLFFPIECLPVFLRPLSYVLPPTYGTDILHGAFSIGNRMPMLIDFALLIVVRIGLFLISPQNIQRRWIIWSLRILYLRDPKVFTFSVGWALPYIGVRLLYEMTQCS